MSAPAILDDIKADLGITDNADDAWLQRRIDGVWARMEVYTSRALCAPPQAFVDDWNRMVVNDQQQPLPPPLHMSPRASVFLRYFPVASIEAVTIDGVDGDPAAVRFDPRTGKLFTLTGQQWSEDLSGVLYMSRTQITYKAGWATLPADLYEIVLGTVGPMWSAKGGASGAAGTINTINVVDVGSVELGQGNPFVQSTLKGVRVEDPLLGPYANMLDIYIDHRSRIGSALFPVTEPVPVVVAAEPPP